MGVFPALVLSCFYLVLSVFLCHWIVLISTKLNNKEIIEELVLMDVSRVKFFPEFGGSRDGFIEMFRTKNKRVLGKKFFIMKDKENGKILKGLYYLKDRRLVNCVGLAKSRFSYNDSFKGLYENY